MRPRCSPLQTLEPSTFKKTDPNISDKTFHKKLRLEVIEWLWRPECPKMFVTLLTRPSAKIGPTIYPLTPKEASQAVFILMDRLSRKFFKVREVQHREQRLRHAFVSEFGAAAGLHYHGWIELPASLEANEFAALIASTWRRMKFADEADVKPAWNDGAVAYMLKDKLTGHFFDHLDLKNIYLG